MVKPDPRTLENGTASGGEGFSMKQFAQRMATTPKQDYSAAWEVPEQPGQAPTHAAPAPEGPLSPPAAGGAPTAATDDKQQRSKDAAKEFIEAYDTLQAWGFSVLSRTQKADKFALDTWPKDRAAHHLARGLEKMGSPEMHWGVGLAIALAPPAYMNYLAAQEYRRAAEAQPKQLPNGKRTTEQLRQAAPAPTGAPHGSGDRGNAPVESGAGTAGSASAARIESEAPRKGPPCAVCTKPTKHKRGKYCSQHCAGVGTAALMEQRRAAKATPKP